MVVPMKGAAHFSRMSSTFFHPVFCASCFAVKPHKMEDDLDNSMKLKLNKILSCDGRKDADVGSRKKCRSIDRTKRRVFPGNKKWEMQRERTATFRPLQIITEGYVNCKD